MKKDSFFEKKYLEAGVVGFELAGSIGVGLFLGTYLDKKFETDPVLTILFFFLGLAAGVRSFYRFYKKAKKMMEEDSPKENE